MQCLRLVLDPTPAKEDDILFELNLVLPFQTLYIPHGWSYVVFNSDESLALTELKLTDGGLELATAALPESQIHLMKKELQVCTTDNKYYKVIVCPTILTI